jgi:hypothetical protein
MCVFVTRYYPQIHHWIPLCFFHDAISQQYLIVYMNAYVYCILLRIICIYFLLADESAVQLTFTFIRTQMCYVLADNTQSADLSLSLSVRKVKDDVSQMSFLVAGKNNCFFARVIPLAALNECNFLIMLLCLVLVYKCMFLFFLSWFCAFFRTVCFSYCAHCPAQEMSAYGAFPVSSSP